MTTYSIKNWLFLICFLSVFRVFSQDGMVVYFEPTMAFSPMLSFLVVITALIGGAHRLWGPILGVVPFVLVWDLITAKFPNQTALMLGVAFLLIVYAIPHGFVGLGEKYWAKYKEWRVSP